MFYLDLESFGVIKEQLKMQFYKVIEEAWESLGDDYFDPLIKSMKSCANAILEAKRLYTRYQFKLRYVLLLLYIYTIKLLYN